MRWKFVGALVLIQVLGVATAKAGFIMDPNPGGVALNLAKGTDVTSTTGLVGSETIGIASNGLEFFDAASGNATIKPVNGGLLNSLTFTPVNDTLFSDFSFRGQLTGTANGTVTVHWVASDGLSGDITFTGLGANQDYQPIGIYSIDGETLKSATLTAGGDGFKAAKQFEFSEHDAFTQQAVPEPSTLTLLLVGLGGIGLIPRLRRKLK